MSELVPIRVVEYDNQQISLPASGGNGVVGNHLRITIDDCVPDDSFGRLDGSVKKILKNLTISRLVV